MSNETSETSSPISEKTGNFNTYYAALKREATHQPQNSPQNAIQNNPTLDLLKTPSKLATPNISYNAAKVVSRTDAEFTKLLTTHINIGRLANAPDKGVLLENNALFERPCLILGAPSSGKSVSLFRMVEEAAHQKRKVILIFDGRYLSQFTSEMAVIGLGKATPEGAVKVSLPFSHLKEGDLATLIACYDNHQRALLSRAIKRIKLKSFLESTANGELSSAELNSLTTDQLFQESISRGVTTNDEDNQFLFRYLASPYLEFNLQKLPAEMERLASFGEDENILAAKKDNKLRSQHLFLDEVLARLEDLLTHPSFDLFRPSLSEASSPEREPLLFQMIDDFLRHSEVNILAITLRGLSDKNNARLVVVNSVIRHLLDLSHLGIFSEHGALVAIDDSEKYLPPHDLPNLDALHMLAKEGGRFELGSAFVASSIKELPTAIKKEIGTLLTHQIKSQAEKDALARSSSLPDAFKSSLVLPSAPGEALLTARNVSAPIFLKVEPPQAMQLPSSSDELS
jgi:hypothetical protein